MLLEAATSGNLSQSVEGHLCNLLNKIVFKNDHKNIKYVQILIYMIIFFFIVLCFHCCGRHYGYC